MTSVEKYQNFTQDLHTRIYRSPLPYDSWIRRSCAFVGPLSSTHVVHQEQPLLPIQITTILPKMFSCRNLIQGCVHTYISIYLATLIGIGIESRRLNLTLSCFADRARTYCSLRTQTL
ncbi:hypothetical protein BT96DRAFT_452536 [Gymnopus androsaceus JB14]|uniref:Uncharacterized protein n=1 Tax=Gymnopus androsaceus JB14 TaxID=1447944 RepID=A0A6A4I4Z3_9AGAR|nr:hypothetical protein BT96DRAFT_452536 [Gymnopus androsaceus JB14]